jgi:O-antigen/teichoic acid export membrane protein
LPAVPPLQYLLPGIVTFSTVRILGGHLVGRGRIVALTVVSTIILVVNVIMNLVLIPTWGVIGASISSSVTYTINAILFAWLLSQEGYVRPIDVLLPKREDFVVLIQGLTRILKRTGRHMKSSAEVTP